MRAIIAVTLALITPTATQAELVTYEVTGAFEDGATLSGQFTFDNQGSYLNQFKGAALKVRDVTFNKVSGSGYSYNGLEVSPFFVQFTDSVGSSRLSLGFQGLHSDLDLRGIASSALIINNGYQASGFVSPRLANGTINLVPSVPEPLTWTMMLVGFGMIGAASRYRRRSVKVSLA